MSLAFDIGQGAGLAGATGVRPFLPPILTGALASGDVGVDFDDTSFDWVESPGFLLAVLALSVVFYLVERQLSPRDSRDGRSPLQAAIAVVAMALGAVLFGASLAEGGQTEWPGVIAGMACAFLGFVAVAMLFARARARLEGGAAALLGVYADATSLVIAGLSILIHPLGYVALVVFLVLLVRAGRGGDQKYEGLRILR
jgi:hypothetical protein